VTLTRADLTALCALFERAPEPGNLRRPNAVHAFFSQWRQWRAEAAEVLAALDGAGAAASPSAPEAPGVAPGARGADVRAKAVARREASP
jgi:hypothetical protein